MMTTIYVNVGNSGLSPGNPWDYNEINAGSTSTGTLKADLLDDLGASTGIGLDQIIAFGGAGGTSATATSGAGGWPEGVFDSFWYFTAGTPKHRLTGLTNGDSYTIEVAAHQNVPVGRDTDITIGGTTERYAVSGTASPSPPITISGTISGTTLDIDFALVSTAGYLSGYKITITPPPSYTITSIDGDNDVQAGQTNVDIVMTATTGVTSVTLGGETLTINRDNLALPLSSWTIGSNANGTIAIATTDTTDDTFDGSVTGGTSGTPIWAQFDVGATRDIYIEFDARMPNAKEGLKFCKIFSDNDGGYANCTFGLDYNNVDNGSMRAVSFGDGTSNQNDTQNVIQFEGTNPSWIGRSYGVTANVSTPQNAVWPSSNWGTDWHTFKLHVRFNSGTTAENEVADGKFFVSIDGVTYVDASGLFNRHYSNIQDYRVELYGYWQNGSGPFDLDYKNIFVSTEGFR